MLPVVVFVLAAAVFAQGTSEFMLSGLLPSIAADCGVSVGTAGLLTSLFAVGMVLGAPAMTAIPISRRPALIGFLLLFSASHVVGALTVDFGVLLGTRAVAAVANAGFLAVALASLPSLAPPALVGRATSVILAGVTVACIVGVPAGTVLGQYLGWHATFWAVAAITAACALFPLRVKDSPRDSVVDEWRSVRCFRLILVGVLVNAATFAGFTYLGVFAAGFGGVWVPVALALFGLGSFAGVTAAGRGLVRFGPAVLVVVWLAALLASASLPGLLIAAFACGACSFGVGATLIGAIVRTASAAAPNIAGALATTAFNVGAVAGPALAGLAVSQAFLVSAGFALVAAVVRPRGTW
ncbi:MFS transporter [Kutzneria sp. NPDC052558]|uniref:MFS transporter n=1 Tax=Kutzneria sp. NPDC052558 TaxID=3364121 RepID=UPI0037CCBCC2